MLDQYFRSTRSSDKHIPTRTSRIKHDQRRRYLGVNFGASSVPLTISISFLRFACLRGKKRSGVVRSDTLSGGIFISDDSPLATVSLIVNSDASSPRPSGASRPAPSRPSAPKIRVRRGGGDVSAKRRKTQPQECYFNHRAMKKKSHSENIYLLYCGKR